MKRKPRSIWHVVELALDPQDFPNQAAFAALMERLPALGELKCIELGIAPQGGGRLSFVIQGAAGTLREALRSLVGQDAIIRCRVRAA